MERGCSGHVAHGESSHRQAGLPRELADAIEELIRSERWLGHRSMSGFATDACRRLLAECYRDLERRDALSMRQGNLQGPHGGALEAKMEMKGKDGAPGPGPDELWPNRLEPR